jgi:hypothetical protein
MTATISNNGWGIDALVVTTGSAVEVIAAEAGS